MNNYKLFISNDGGYNYKEIPAGNDWTIKKDWNKLDDFTFRSEKNLKIGTHVRFLNNETRLFSGQILKITTNNSRINNYEALSYGLPLRSKVTTTFKNKTSSAIVEWIKSKVPGLTWKIGATKKKHTTLAFEEKTLLEILQNLVWIEYNLNNLIDFNIDDRVVTFKPLPGEVKGYTISNAFDFSGDISFDNVVTGFTVTVNGKVVKTYNNDYLSAIFGTIYATKSLTQEKDQKAWTKKQIKTKIQTVAKRYKKLKYKANTPNWETGYLRGESNDYLLSIHLKRIMQGNNIPGAVVKYKKAGKTQYSIIYKAENETLRFPYTQYGYAAGFRDSRNALKATKINSCGFYGKI